MIDPKDITIEESVSVKTGLQRLNESYTYAMTLFVVNEKGQMTGTLSDGDIRRAMIKGATINDPLKTVMHTDFCFLSDPLDVFKLKKYRDKKISLIPVLDRNGHIIRVIDLTQKKSALPIDAVLMAGGKGERLRPLTLETPKPLLEIGGKPIIDHNIEKLVDFGIPRAYVTVNYKKDKIINHFKDRSFDGTNIRCVEEEKFLGTIGALKLITDFKNDTILVMNSDLITNINFEDFYCHFKKNKAVLSAAAIPYSVNIPYGIFDLCGNEITGVKEKPIYNYYANAGIYLMSKEALEYIPEGVEFNAIQLIEKLLANKKKVIRFPLSGLWIDIGTHQDFKKANDLIYNSNT